MQTSPLYTRRQVLRMAGAAGAGSVLQTRMGDVQTLTPAVSAVDHLLLGAADLDRGIEWIERRTGVKGAAGGSHPGRGTRNALLSLGGRHYLEIIAPDPAQTTLDFEVDLRRLAEPRLVTWAAATTDISNLARRAGAAGLQAVGPRDGSRVTPGGKTLAWRTLGVVHDLARDDVDPVPFFIEWAAGTSHPSGDAPSGCRLDSLVIEHPAASKVAATLKALGIEAQVRQAARARLSAVLQSPNGRVELT